MWRISFIAVACVVVLAVVVVAEDAGDFLRDGKRFRQHGQLAEAEESFERAVRVAEGDELREALFLLAGTVRSGARATELYRRVLADGEQDRWSERATIELAKIEFALGHYEGARSLFGSMRDCGEEDEACLFAGLASLMSHHYEDAVLSLERVDGGRDRAWAEVALAEALDGAGRRDEACHRYEALRRERRSPVAWYRHAECLEAAGARDEALREYEALAGAFPQSPEGMRAAEKRPQTAPERTETPAPATPDSRPPGPGFTLQFGSFSDRANAIKLYARLKADFPSVRIDSELVNHREVFRVRLGHYATREDALEAGEAMSRRIDEPFTIMPVSPTP